MIVAEQIQTALDGAQHRLIATQAATGTTPKEMAVPSEILEVVVSEPRLLSWGSQFGHVAIIAG